MQLSTVFRRIAAVADRAWMNCESAENRELLWEVASALRNAADEISRREENAAIKPSALGGGKTEA